MMSRHLARVINDLFSFAVETVFSAKQAVTHVQMSRPQTIFLCLNQLWAKCALSNSWSIKRQSRSRLAQFRHLKEAWTITQPSLSVKPPSRKILDCNPPSKIVTPFKDCYPLKDCNPPSKIVTPSKIFTPPKDCKPSKIVTHPQKALFYLILLMRTANSSLPPVSIIFWNQNCFSNPGQNTSDLFTWTT